MAIIRLLPNALHFREFQNDPITGHRYHGTCGETALATAMVCATPQIETTDQAISLMMAMTREMMAKGWADKPDGNSRTQTLMWEAKARGFQIDTDHYVQYVDPIPSAKLHPMLRELAGVEPIVLMVTNAGPGLTAVDGSHDERGVRGHFICVVGIADEGYICNDGDNNEITYKLVTYPWSAIEAANVTGFLALKMEGSHVAVPSTWTDKDGVITAPNGHKVESGFAEFIRNNPWEADDEPIEEERKNVSLELFNPKLGQGSQQFFHRTVLEWRDPAIKDGQPTGVFKMYVGDELMVTRGKLAEALSLVQQLRDAASQPVPFTLSPDQHQAIQNMLSALKY